jgi:hypothetical protein
MATSERALPVTAAGIARKRLEEYLDAKLEKEDDLAEWEFYTWLLEKAERHEVDCSGYVPLAYQDDRKAARKARLAGQGGAACKPALPTL